MATTKIPARDFTIEIDSAYPGTPAWTPIGGLNSLTPSPSTNRADTTDFDSNGEINGDMSITDALAAIDAAVNDALSVAGY